MIFKSFKCLFFLVLVVNYTYSQELVPPIQNYIPSEYSAASQNWDIALDERGVVYVANNQGLLVFDGISWELHPLESESIIRSVYPFRERVYTGSYREFGYWETLPDGSMNYTSLSPLMEEFNLQSDEFWEIIAHEEIIYFRSFGGVYKYEDNKISRISDIVSTALGVYNNKLILSPRMQGLSFLGANGDLKSLKGTEELDGLNIIALEAFGDKLYIASKEALFT